MNSVCISLRGLWTRGEYDLAAEALLGEANPALKESFAVFTKAGQAMGLRLEDEEIEGILVESVDLSGDPLENLLDAANAFRGSLRPGQRIEVRVGANYENYQLGESVFVDSVTLFSPDDIEEWKELDGLLVVQNIAGLKPPAPLFAIIQGD